MILSSPDEASTRLFTMAGATAMIAPPAAACFSRVRREKSRTARCVFSLDVGFAFLVTLVLPKTLTCLRGAHLRRPLPRAQVFLRCILSLDLNLAAAMKASQGQLGTADGASRARTGTPMPAPRSAERRDSPGFGRLFGRGWESRPRPGRL